MQVVNPSRQLLAFALFVGVFVVSPVVIPAVQQGVGELVTGSSTPQMGGDFGTSTGAGQKQSVGSAPADGKRSHVALDEAGPFRLGISSAHAQAVRPNRGSKVPILVTRLLNKDQVRLAHQEVTKLLVNNPDDPELHAAYGGVLSRSSLYPDAVQAFGDSLGSTWYERRGLGYHADALAQVGRGDEAAELRLSQLVNVNDPESKRALSIRGSAIEDRIVSGDLGKAMDEASELTLDFPDFGYAWVQLAWVQLELGMLDDVDWSLFQADRLGERQMLRRSMVRSESMARQGRLWRAFAEVEHHKSDHFKNAEYWAHRIELLRRIGTPEDGLMTTELDRFNYQQHPTFTAARAGCLADLGRTPEALALLTEALEGHPNNRALLRRYAEITDSPANGD